MKDKHIKGIIFIALLIFVGGETTWRYNIFVSKENDVQTEWAKVEAEYQRRQDLLINLIEVVKGQAKFEKGLLVDVIEERVKGVGTITNSELNIDRYKSSAIKQQEISDIFGHLLGVVERYPQLKSLDGFLNLQEELEVTENRIFVARKEFTESVQEYNITIQRFPGSIFAKIFQYTKLPYYQSDDGAEKAPKIDKITE